MNRLAFLVPAATISIGLISVFAANHSLTAGLIAAVLLGIVVGGFILGRVLATGRSVETAARSIAAGNYAARAEAGGPAELASLTEAFNLMAQQVQSQMAHASEGRSRLMAALDSSVDPVLALDIEGRVVFANLAAQRLFGLDAKAIAGNSAAGLLPDERVVDAVRASRERRSQMTIDIERPGRRFFQVVTSPIGGGGEWAVLVVIHDVSDVKRTEQIRRDFAANVSHELRTPLAGIKAVVETLAEGAIDDREAAMDFLSRADSEVDRLIILVEELLELSRIESGEIPLSVQPTDIGAMLRDVVERLRPQAERKRVGLSLDLAEPPGTADIDPDRLERGLLNLVHNAVKFTPEGGSVTLAAARTPNELIFTVRDTGIGIDSADLPRIFERFYKADQSRAGRAGSGIGLAIVKHAVEAHGGAVSAESQLGHGSTFTIRLPLTG